MAVVTKLVGAYEADGGVVGEAKYVVGIGLWWRCREARARPGSGDDQDRPHPRPAQTGTISSPGPERSLVDAV